MKRNSKDIAGFTLVELMAVVAILAILSAVAVVAYQKWIRKAKDSEAISVLGDIKIKQEAYRATFHQYANIPTWAPKGNSNAPSSAAINWRSGDAGILGQWAQLGATPDTHIMFRYFINSGTPGSTPNGKFTGLGIETQNDFWFAARALQDYNDDGQFGGFEIYSGSNKMVTLEEGDVGFPN